MWQVRASPSHTSEHPFFEFGIWIRISEFEGGCCGNSGPMRLLTHCGPAFPGSTYFIVQKWNSTCWPILFVFTCRFLHKSLWLVARWPTLFTYNCRYHDQIFFKLTNPSWPDGSTWNWKKSWKGHLRWQIFQCFCCFSNMKTWRCNMWLLFRHLCKWEKTRLYFEETVINNFSTFLALFHPGIVECGEPSRASHHSVSDNRFFQGQFQNIIDFHITNSDFNHLLFLLHATALTMADLAWLDERLASDD